MASRTLILCLLALGGSLARAEPLSHVLAAALSDDQDAVARHPVAVIDLSNDAAVREVANKLLELLASHADLAPPSVFDGAALIDRLPPDDEQRLAEARKKLSSAVKNLAQRNFREAAIDAVDGHEILFRVTPRTALPLYADLSLALGLSRLGEQKDTDAREEFVLTSRLDPGRTLDDLHYVPEVIAMFQAARRVVPQAGKVIVHGTGRVWIDGQEVGTAPGEFPAAAGKHVLWLTGAMRETTGAEVTVTATRPGEAMIPDGPLTRPQRVARYRIALAQAPDPAARAIAMKELAAFIHVHDAVLLSVIGGKVVWQTWRDREPGFSEIHELGRDRPGEILRPLVPPRPMTPVVRVVNALPPPPRWYERRTVQLGLVATVAVAIVGGYFWAHYHEPDRVWNTDITGFGNTSGGK
jgi:hypothetical protein